MSKRQSSQTWAQIQKVLGEDVRIANEWSHFSQRNTPLNAERFVQIMVLGWLKHKGGSLNQVAQAGQALGVCVSGSALHERMDQRAVLLLASVFRLGLSRLHGTVGVDIGQLQRFTAIYVSDSTQISLPDKLACVFRGCQANSSVKLQVVWDYLSGNLAALELDEGRSCDQNSRLHVDEAQAGSLQLFDLGYFKQEYLQQIAAQQAYFVCRYQSQTALYTVNERERFDLLAWLSKMRGSEAQIEVLVGGRSQVALRMVARRLPPMLAQARRRKAYAQAKRQGKPYSSTYLALLDWDILLTNLPTSQWSLAQVFALYPIRTQIEWVFRVWKDHLGVDEIGNWRVERVLCQLYAHLIAALVCHRLTCAWRWRGSHEFSFAKCVQIIQTAVSDLMRCLARLGWGITAWFRRLEADFQRFGRKSKRRKSPSTAQRLYNWGLS